MAKRQESPRNRRRREERSRRKHAVRSEVESPPPEAQATRSEFREDPYIQNLIDSRLADFDNATLIGGVFPLGPFAFVSKFNRRLGLVEKRVDPRGLPPLTPYVEVVFSIASSSVVMPGDGKIPDAQIDAMLEVTELANQYYYAIVLEDFARLQPELFKHGEMTSLVLPFRDLVDLRGVRPLYG